MKNEIAIFGAGCFWGVEELFRVIPGVLETSVGYMGGHLKNPTYQDVCTDKTGHAEVVKITFDSEVITYLELLKQFFENHDPTTLNRQGPDYGTQYRSVVFYNSKSQKDIAKKLICTYKETNKFKKTIVTQLVKVSEFYPAEDYHQKYLFKRGLNYCHI